MSTDLTLKQVCKRMGNTIHPSFLKLLCEQGKIEHSSVPARDARCNDIILIPEDELDNIQKILFESSQVKDLTQEVKKVEIEEKWLSKDEVAELLGCTGANVLLLKKKGLIEAKESKSENGQRIFVYSEKSVLACMEQREKAKSKPKEVEPGSYTRAELIDGLSKKEKELTEKDTEIENLKKALDSKDKTMHYFENKSNKLKERVANLEMELNSTRRRCKELEEELKKEPDINVLANIKTLKLQNELDEKIQEIKNLKEKHDISAKDKEIHELKLELDNKIGLLEGSRNTIDNLRESNKYLQEKLEKLNEKLDDKDTFDKGYLQCKKDLMSMIMDM